MSPMLDSRNTRLENTQSTTMQQVIPELAVPIAIGVRLRHDIFFTGELGHSLVSVWVETNNTQTDGRVIGLL